MAKAALFQTHTHKKPPPPPYQQETGNHHTWINTDNNGCLMYCSAHLCKIRTNFKKTKKQTEQLVISLWMYDTYCVDCSRGWTTCTLCVGLKMTARWRHTTEGHYKQQHCWRIIIPPSRANVLLSFDVYNAVTHEMRLVLLNHTVEGELLLYLFRFFPPGFR